jgi:integrase/recombinase XerC
LARSTGLRPVSAPFFRSDARRFQGRRVPGEPKALAAVGQGRVERASLRRGARDAAIIAVLLYAGARVEECARLDLEDVAITARTGRIRLHGKGDEVRDIPLPVMARERLSEWIAVRGNAAGPLWTGQLGRLTISGITQVVLAVGEDAGIPGCARASCATP